MQLCKFLKLMGILTILAVVYIHMQMQIIDLAYAGNKKEQQIKKLIEQNGSTTYKILMLKSANHLGDTILEDGSDMQFADTDDVVRTADLDAAGLERGDGVVALLIGHDEDDVRPIGGHF